MKRPKASQIGWYVSSVILGKAALKVPYTLPFVMPAGEWTSERDVQTDCHVDGSAVAALW